MKLNTKIAATVLQAAFIPWVLAGGIAYFSAQEQINTKTYTDLDAFANLRAHWLQDAIASKLDALSLFSNDPELIQLFAAYNKKPTILTQQNLQAYLASELGNITSIHKVFLATPEGVVVAASDTALIGTNVSAEEYFKLGTHANDASTLKKDASGALTQYLAGPVLVRGQFEGVVVAETDMHEIVSVAEEYAGLGNTGEIVLVKREGNNGALFLTPTRFDPSAALSRIVTESDQIAYPALSAVAGKESVLINAVDYRGVKVFAATRYISSVGWGMVVKIDQSEALSPIKKLGELFSLIIIIAGVFIVLIGLALSKSITNPINELTAFVKKFARGEDLQETFVVTSKDEVGMLGEAFNGMIARLKKAYTTLEQEVDERTRELTEKTEEARNNEKAALNIAADLKDEEEKLSLEKSVAEKLANDLKKFKLALDNASDQVTITDPEGIVIYANAALRKISGYLPEEVVGKKAGEMWKLPMPSEYYQQLWHTIRDEKQVFMGEIQNRRKNGDVYTAMITISPVLDTIGTILFFVSLERDITKEKEVDKAKNEFISLASHQMRTPLTAINWYTEMLLGGDAGNLNEKQGKYFKSIYAAAGQMNDILKAFLHILRLETGTVLMNPVSIDTKEIMQKTVMESELTIDKKHLRVTEHYADPLPPVFVDPEILHVVLQNLVTNAAKYTPENGEITLSLTTVASGSVVAGKTALRDSLLIRVADTGIGIAPDMQDKIFGKFFRADNAKKWDPNGNGLGLYMSHKMVEIFGGMIWFESEEGKGTTFSVLIPLDTRKS